MAVQTANILVVDDELGIREGVRRVLIREGHRVVGANSGEAGWELLQSNDFDLVLIDVMMSDISGMELLERVVELNPNIVCIMITGYATISMAVQAIKNGAYDFVAKPFDANTLLLAVNQGLDRRRLAMEASRLADVEKEKEALERRQVELEQLDRVKSAFTVTVAHELRAPVAAIQSYLRLILDGYIPAERQREYLIRIETRARAQLELIGDLLDLARLRNPDLCIERESVDVTQELRETCELMTGQTQEKSLQFSVSIPEGPIHVWASARHIKQLWSNLISNAVKYTEEGSVTVTMEVQDSKVITCVTDTGIGIAKEGLQRIFEDFYRTKAAKAYTQMGTGLGLSLVKRIVETYGGEINVQSIVGEGSQFTVTLPLLALTLPTEQQDETQ